MVEGLHRLSTPVQQSCMQMTTAGIFSDKHGGVQKPQQQTHPQNNNNNNGCLYLPPPPTSPVRWPISLVRNTQYNSFTIPSCGEL